MITVLQLFKSYKGNFPLLNEMARLDQSRFRTVACYLGGAPDGGNEMERLASRTIYLGCRSSELRWYNLPLLRRLRQIIDEEGVQIVNCQLHRPTPLGVGASLLSANRPLVLSTIHGIGGGAFWKRRLQNWIWHRLLYRIVAVSQAVRADILRSDPGLPPEKVVTILNGLDLERFSPGEDKVAVRRRLLPGVEAGFWFGTAGRLSPVKNHAALIRAFGLVVARHPDCVLLLAGRGELEGAMKELVVGLGLSEKVVFLGYRNDLPELYRALDAFVFPSLREGFGLSMLEAMAAGLPVVAARVGGIPEIFADEPMGIMIDPTDEAGLADAMLELCSTPPEALRSMGSVARLRALARFRSDRMIADYEALYEEAHQAWSERRPGQAQLR